MKIKKLPAYSVYLIAVGTFSVLFTMMAFISALYRVQSAGLNPLQLVLLGTALEMAVFLFEVPTGIVADVYSRRLSVIIGYAVIALGFMLEGAIPRFGPILLAQAVWGIGYTFISGAQDAWLADEIGEARLTEAYLRASQVGNFGALAGILISTALGTVHLGLPIFLSGVALLGLSLLLLLFMPETGFVSVRQPHHTPWQNLTTTLRDGLRVVRGRRLLLLILGIAAFFGLSSEGLDRLWEAHLLQNFTFPTLGPVQEPVFWFSGLSIIELVLGIGIAELIRRHVAKARPEAAVRLQLGMTVIVILAVFLFGLANRFGVALAAILAVQVFRGAISPLFSAWINKQIEPRVRATVLSMSGQIDAIGQVIGGPILGAVATALSIPAAMVGVGLLLAPASVLYLVALRWMRGPVAGEPLPGASATTQPEPAPYDGD